MSIPIDWIPIRFIGEPIEVLFNEPPALEKKPGCPQAFIWRGETYSVQAILSEWRDYERRGRMSSNMRPEHAAIARQRGSWGVGTFYFRIKTNLGSVFDIYYDRAPKDASHRKGAWFIYQELKPADE